MEWTFENIGVMLGSAIATATAMFFMMKFWQVKFTQKLIMAMKDEYREKYEEKAVVNAKFDNITNELSTHKLKCNVDYEIRFERINSAIQLLSATQSNIQKTIQDMFSQITNRIESLEKKFDVLFDKLYEDK